MAVALGRAYPYLVLRLAKHQVDVFRRVALKGWYRGAMVRGYKGLVLDWQHARRARPRPRHSGCLVTPTCSAGNYPTRNKSLHLVV